MSDYLDKLKNTPLHELLATCNSKSEFLMKIKNKRYLGRGDFFLCRGELYAIVSLDRTMETSFITNDLFDKTNWDHVYVATKSGEIISITELWDNENPPKDDL